MPDSEAFGDVGVDTFGHIAYTVKTMEIPNLKKLGMLNLRPTKDIQFAAFGAAIKDAFFVVSVKQKREFCWRFSTFSSTLKEKGGDAFGTTGIQLFFKTYYAVVLR